MYQLIKALLQLNYNLSCDKIDHRHIAIWTFTLDTTDMTSDYIYFQQIQCCH